MLFVCWSRAVARCARGAFESAPRLALGKTLSAVKLEVLRELCSGHSRLAFNLHFVERECSVCGAREKHIIVEREFARREFEIVDRSRMHAVYEEALAAELGVCARPG